MEDRIKQLASQGKSAEEIQLIFLWDLNQNVPLGFIKENMK